MRTQRHVTRPVDYERAIAALDGPHRSFSAEIIERFNARLRVKPEHSLERLREVLLTDPMNKRFPL